ncbi:hypothetical protein CHLRE_03g156200v5 [Chlamydomonas reinhardtii]|uniref:C-type lectin domain-containing protein n=1 Tax=Chlamydomonas reinhardtii TaxID=3055 RepID=A0A2K3DW23_CHLRE|nr:uncharacterized protein CHLRE_03g156200v5 [Chlamydomonas reinhardtii]PNW84726.1 hypothetical protein CHLRE_03g156200v5 [Chlamydomonas reinhardtii]
MARHPSLAAAVALLLLAVCVGPALAQRKKSPPPSPLSLGICRRGKCPPPPTEGGSEDPVASPPPPAGGKKKKPPPPGNSLGLCRRGKCPPPPAEGGEPQTASPPPPAEKASPPPPVGAGLGLCRRGKCPPPPVGEVDASPPPPTSSTLQPPSPPPPPASTSPPPSPPPPSPPPPSPPPPGPPPPSPPPPNPPPPDPPPPSPPPPNPPPPDARPSPPPSPPAPPPSPPYISPQPPPPPPPPPRPPRPIASTGSFAQFTMGNYTYEFLQKRLNFPDATIKNKKTKIKRSAFTIARARALGHSKAEAHCNSRGGNLVSLTSFEENSAVIAKIAELGLYNKMMDPGSTANLDLWIGLRTNLIANTFWTDGSGLTYLPSLFLGGIDTYQDGLCYTMSCRADNSCKWSAVLPPAEGCVNVTRGNFICKYDTSLVKLTWQDSAFNSSYALFKPAPPGQPYFYSNYLCTKINGRLVTPNNEAEFRMLVNKVYDVYTTNTTFSPGELDSIGNLRLWIGLYFQTSLSDSFWQDGTRADENPLAFKVSLQLPQTCYAMHCRTGYCDWQPIWCGTSLPGFICEVRGAYP